MGVKGLHTLLEGRLPQAAHRTTLPALADAAFASGSSGTIVIDGMALIRKLYTPDLEWVCGGQYQELWLHVQNFVQAFQRCNLKLAVFIDGGVDDAKLREWQARRSKDLQKVERVVDSLRGGTEPPNSAWMPPPNISKAVAAAFAQHGCDVYQTAGEADRELASFCTSHGCAAVLAKDSDFFVLPVPRYLNLDTLQLHASPPTVTVYHRADIESALALPSSMLPLMGSLVGNDFVPTELLSDFHRALLPGRHAAGAPLIDAVARHVASAAAAVGWRGPCPSTPLLWAALDWDGRLGTRARELIELSLDQYAVEGFVEALPMALVERAAAASSAMLRRFRRGQLDSSVFTSATCQAIWRGPSIDNPDSAPTILVSRPIRCETYAACIQPALRGKATRACSSSDGACGTAERAAKAQRAGSGISEPPSGAVDQEAEAGDASGAAGAGAGAGARGEACSSACVTEHIIYSAQPSAGAPERVVVPPQLVSCEEMWALDQTARCSCMLRALGRAFRGDRTVASLDTAAFISLGPVALTTLTVRFLRRHGRVPRVAALVMLCQGLVMAWLSATRQRLPPELRKRPRRQQTAGSDMLQAAHLASLFTRASTDLAIFNSACGDPLVLHGPWEWFDGVLFEGMLFTAASSSAASQADFGASGCWAALLRKDAGLLGVLNVLRPLALATEGAEKAEQPMQNAVAASSDSAQKQANMAWPDWAADARPEVASTAAAKAWREATRSRPV